MNLIDYLAKSCYYAQQHIDCDLAWDTRSSYRENLLQCVSYQVACFLAQNTVDGSEGVGWEVIIDQLSEWPAKSERAWREIIEYEVEKLGGLKNLS